MKIKFLHKWPYFQTLTQMTNESQIFTQMATFLHIEHISYKYPMKVKFSLNWPYFHTLSILYIIILLFFIVLLVFLNLDFFMVVVVQERRFIGRWYSWLDHRGGERRNFIKLIKLFLIDRILDSADSSFFRYNHLKSFVCCVWNIEHLSNVFC
jgi:hypothetical protein